MWDRSETAPAAHKPMQHAPTDMTSARLLSYKYWQFGKISVCILLIGHVAFIYLFYALGQPALAVLNFFSVGVYACGLRLQRNGDFRRASQLVFGETVLHAAVVTFVLGWHTGFHLYILAIIPALFFDASFDFRRKVACGLSVTFSYMALMLFTDRLMAQSVLGVQTDWLLWKMNLIGTLLLLCYLGCKHAAITEKSHQELYLLATFDSLTGLFNRHRFNDIVTYELDRSRRSGKPNSLILMDIDFFKQVNDCFGHDAGDFALKEIASLIRNNIRDLDVVARWGGEEFLLLATETRAEDAIAVAERIRLAVEADPIAFDGHTWHMTITLGISQFVPGEPSDCCLKRADQAMYQGKTAGRNRTVVR